MSRVGNPYDNAKAERFIKTLKRDEVDGTIYRDIRPPAGHDRGVHRPDLQPRALHSALDYRPPVEFEAEHRARSRRRGLSPRWVLKAYGNLR